MVRSIVITSGKGGVGKTTLAANLGRSLALLGKRVLLIDTDLGLNNLDVALNLEKRVIFDIVDVTSAKCRLRQAIIEDSVPGVFLLPSAHTYDQSGITAAALKQLIDSLVGFDFCLVDCPAGIEAGFHRAVSACGEALVVTTPHLSALKDAGKVISILKTYQIRPSLVLNRLRGDLLVSGDTVDVDTIRDIIPAPIVGVVPEDDSIGICGNTGGRLPKTSESYKATMVLAKNIISGTEVIYDVSRRYKGLFGRLKRRAR